jgi:ABC-2 type transport system permease protein
VVLQICSSRFGMNSLGNLAVGGVLAGSALAHLPVRWTPAHALLAPLVFACAMLVKVALLVAANATSFWSTSPYNTFAIGMDHLGNLTRYPLSIYWSGLRAVLSTAVPFAFVGFFPASFILGHGGLAWLGLLTPVAAAYCVLLTLLVFRLGLRRYESTGH